jgi:NADH dehydrogenase
VRRAAAVALGVVALLVLAAPARAQASESIDRYDVEIVIGDDGALTITETIAYDFVILAAGAAHSYFGHEEWEAYAPCLKSFEDALEIRRRVLLAFESAEHEQRAE